MIFGTKPERVIAEIEEFVTGAPPSVATNRVLATILVLDMVGSTERLSQLGDAAWRDLLERYYELADRELRAFGGEEVGDCYPAAILGCMAYTDYHWIIDRLAIGGFVHESEDLPFDAILSMETAAPTVLRELVRSGRVDYQWRSILDGICDEDHDAIVGRFDDAAAQLDAWLREEKRVLVHCYAGVSRSVTAVIWYLMCHQGHTWDEALELIRARRSVANPNIRFEIPLRLAAGEDLAEEWIDQRIGAYCERQRADYNVEVDPAEIWDTLERQGTFRRSSAAAS